MEQWFRISCVCGRQLEDDQEKYTSLFKSLGHGTLSKVDLDWDVVFWMRINIWNTTNKVLFKRNCNKIQITTNDWFKFIFIFYCLWHVQSYDDVSQLRLLWHFSKDLWNMLFTMLDNPTSLASLNTMSYGATCLG